MPAPSQMNPAVKLVLELGPLVVFFTANARWNIFVGTAAFMVAVLAAFAELVRAGEVVTRAALPEIRKWMSVDSQARTKVPTPAVTQPAVMPADL